MKDVDRAILEGKSEGFVRVHVRKGTDAIVGATIVAEHAGDMIGEFALAMTTSRSIPKWKKLILDAGNGRNTQLHEPQTIHSLFEEQVSRVVNIVKERQVKSDV